jgi:putative DNA primase/helicase
LSGELIAVQTKQLGKKGITHGRMEDAAVQLAVCEDVLGLAEGVETALSATQMTGVPCWAVLGARRLDKVQIPAAVTRLYLFADNDDPGREAAARAFVRYHNPPSCKVIPWYPPEPHKDWNDFLQATGGNHG